MAAGKLAVAFFALGMVAIVVGAMVPATIDAQDAEARDTVLLEEGDTAEFDDVIELELLAVNNAESFVNVTVRDIETQSDANITNLSVGETKTVSPVSDNVSVTLEEIETGNSADLTPSFSRTYGWNGGAKLFMNEMDTMLTLVGFVMVVGGLGAVMKG